MSAHSVRPTGPLAPQYIHGVYIPAGLIIFGTFIVKKEWLPYAVALAAILGAWKIYNNRTGTNLTVATVAYMVRRGP